MMRTGADVAAADHVHKPPRVLSVYDDWPCHLTTGTGLACRSGLVAGMPDRILQCQGVLTSGLVEGCVSQSRQSSMASADIADDLWFRSGLPSEHLRQVAVGEPPFLGYPRTERST